MSSTDSIEKSILLRAPQSRVWRALTDTREFSTWFRVALEGPFVVGQAVRGHMTHPGYEHVRMEAWVERIEPEHTFTFRWHPYAVDPARDYADEPTTLVEFRLERQGDATMLHVRESGFDRLPADRREQAFRMNASGWTSQLENVERHVGSAT